MIRLWKASRIPILAAAWNKIRKIGDTWRDPLWMGKF